MIVLQKTGDTEAGAQVWQVHLADDCADDGRGPTIGFLERSNGSDYQQTLAGWTFELQTGSDVMDLALMRAGWRTSFVPGPRGNIEEQIVGMIQHAGGRNR
jgi:hypothetical protein